MRYRYEKKLIYTQNKIEQTLINEFKKRGFNSIFGTVAPLRSLMVWKKESIKKFKVKLPESIQIVNVIFLEQFIESGWLHYATFGKHYVGGWAKETALYCVKKAYEIKSDKFKIHYLVHEAQHYSDYQLFPKLAASDLEYRAKLAELAVTKKPKNFVSKLLLQAKNDKKNPHSFAADRILSKLDKKMPSKVLNQKAIKLLQQDTKRIKFKKRFTT